MHTYLSLCPSLLSVLLQLSVSPLPVFMTISHLQQGREEVTPLCWLAVLPRIPLTSSVRLSPHHSTPKPSLSGKSHHCNWCCYHLFQFAAVIITTITITFAAFVIINFFVLLLASSLVLFCRCCCYHHHHHGFYPGHTLSPSFFPPIAAIANTFTIIVFTTTFLCFFSSLTLSKLFLTKEYNFHQRKEPVAISKLCFAFSEFLVLHFSMINLFLDSLTKIEVKNV